MMRIRAYKIVEGDSPANLAYWVSIAIDMGWQPYGQPFYNGRTHCQTMVAYDVAKE